MFVGDLVNRGPDNLGVLNRIRALNASVVLGNHDLHLLAHLIGVGGRQRPDDTIDDILESSERNDVLDWLLQQPLLRETGDDLIVHAGLLPHWSRAEARGRARRLEQELRRDPARLLDRSRTPKGDLKDLRNDLLAFTRIRTVDGAGVPDTGFSGSLESVPVGLEPWFRAHHADLGPGRVLFGHWASLGHHREGRFVGLDSGCVWGRALTAFRLEDEAVFQVSALAGAPPSIALL